MPNIFDNMGEQAFDVCSLTFGYDASWNDGTSDISGVVLFATPDEKRKLPGVDIEYEDDAPMMEFRPEDFPGLHEAILDDSVLQEITINNIVYYIREGVKISDGLVVKATLELKP